MKQNDFVIRNGFIVYPEKTEAGDIGITGRTITEIGAPGTLTGKECIDASGRLVFPGLVDPHTHPVYLDSIQDLSRTAAWGGVTTVIHYAYAKPGMSLTQVIKDWKKEGQDTSYIDFALHGGMFETLKQAEEIPEAFSLGVTSFKMFISYKKQGWMTDDYALVKAMDIIGRQKGLACIHAENGLAIDYIQDRLMREKLDFRDNFLTTSPDLVESEAIYRCATLGRLMKCPVYIPHVSSAEGVKILEYLKSTGVPVYAETCPHYLSLTWEKLKELGPLGKVGPSIKTQDDQDSLWKAVRGGLFDTFGSDHAPKDKKVADDFFSAPYGSPQVETMFPVLWQDGVNSGRITPNDIARIGSENPARIFGLSSRKGRIAPGLDADLFIFNPFTEWTIRQDGQHTNARYTLFEGKKITGKIDTVFSGGAIIVDNDSFLGVPGRAEFLPTQARYLTL